MSKKHGVVRDMEQDNLDLMADDLFELTPEQLDEICDEDSEVYKNGLIGNLTDITNE